MAMNSADFPRAEGLSPRPRAFFRDRRDAGRQLAGRLAGFAGRGDVLVLGLARGGVPTALRSCTYVLLAVSLDVLISRKAQLCPGQQELAMGAIASGGVRVLNAQIVRRIPNAEMVIDEVAAAEQRELERRESQYRGDRTPAGCARKGGGRRG